MKTVGQEFAAQIVFYTSMGCVPLTVWLVGKCRRTAATVPRLLLLLMVSITTTHALWYFCCLGVGLSDKIGNMAPIRWYRFYPVGVVVALLTRFLPVAEANTEGSSAAEREGRNSSPTEGSNERPPPRSPPATGAN